MVWLEGGGNRRFLTERLGSRRTVRGFDVAQKVLSKISDIAFIQLTSSDVVRHPLVQKIVKAYEDYEKKINDAHLKAAQKTAGQSSTSGWR